MKHPTWTMEHFLVGMYAGICRPDGRWTKMDSGLLIAEAVETPARPKTRTRTARGWGDREAPKPALVALLCVEAAELCPSDDDARRENRGSGPDCYAILQGYRGDRAGSTLDPAPDQRQIRDTYPALVSCCRPAARPSPQRGRATSTAHPTASRHQRGAGPARSGSWRRDPAVMASASARARGTSLPT